MIVVIEGPDLVGKSTTAQLLGSRLSIPVSRIWMDLDNPKPSAQSVANTLYLVCKALRPTIIFDRLFLSEYVYGAVLNREYDYIQELIWKWQDIPDLYVVQLTARDQVLLDRYKQRKDWYLTEEQVLAASAAYSRLPTILPVNFSHIHIDTSDKQPSHVVTEIINWLYMKREK